MIRTAPMIAAMCLCTAAYATDENGQFAIDGVGGAPCIQFTEASRDIKGQVYAVYAGWTMGYVTAHNRLVDDTFDLTPWQAVEVLLAQVGSFCKANPETSYESALAELVKFLEAKRMKVADEVIQFQHQGQAVVIYKSILTQASEALAAQGYPNDGTPDAMTAAISDFQGKEGLPVTGLPDVNVLARLLLR